MFYNDKFLNFEHTKTRKSPSLLFLFEFSTILGWYTKEQLDEDDAILLEHEVDGRKKAAYLEWLALEGERIKENRVLMLGEDREAHCRRDYFSRIEVTYLSLCLSAFGLIILVLGIFFS